MEQANVGPYRLEAPPIHEFRVERSDGPRWTLLALMILTTLATSLVVATMSIPVALVSLLVSGAATVLVARLLQPIVAVRIGGRRLTLVSSRGRERHLHESVLRLDLDPVKEMLTFDGGQLPLSSFSEDDLPAIFDALGELVGYDVEKVRPHVMRLPNGTLVRRPLKRAPLRIERRHEAYGLFMMTSMVVWFTITGFLRVYAPEAWPEAGLLGLGVFFLSILPVPLIDLFITLVRAAIHRPTRPS